MRAFIFDDIALAVRSDLQKSLQEKPRRKPGASRFPLGGRRLEYSLSCILSRPRRERLGRDEIDIRSANRSENSSRFPFDLRSANCTGHLFYGQSLGQEILDEMLKLSTNVTKAMTWNKIVYRIKHLSVEKIMRKAKIQYKRFKLEQA